MSKKKKEFVSFDVGFETDPSTRGILDSNGHYQLYFVNNNKEKTKILFFNDNGSISDSVLFSFPLHKEINNLYVISKDTILNMVSQENKLQVINKRGNLIDELNIYDVIGRQNHNDNTLFIKCNFNNSNFKKDPNFLMYSVYNFFNDDFFDKNDFNSYRQENSKSYRALKISGLYNGSLKAELGLKGLFFDKNDPYRITEIYDDKILKFHQDYIYFSAHTNYVYLFDYNFNIIDKIQLLNSSIHQQGNYYIQDIVYDYRSDFTAIVICEINLNSIDNIDINNEPIISFHIDIYNKKWEKITTKKYDINDYNFYSVIILKNKLYVEKNSDTYGKVTYEIFDIM